MSVCSFTSTDYTGLQHDIKQMEMLDGELSAVSYYANLLLPGLQMGRALLIAVPEETPSLWRVILKGKKKRFHVSNFKIQRRQKSLLCILIEFILILTDNDISFDVV